MPDLSKSQIFAKQTKNIFEKFISFEYKSTIIYQLASFRET